MYECIKEKEKERNLHASVLDERPCVRRESRHHRADVLVDLTDLLNGGRNSKLNGRDIRKGKMIT